MDFLQGSTGALFWPAYLLWIRVDTAERASPADFFFFLCSLMQSEIGPDSDCYGLKYLFKQKKEKKKREKRRRKNVKDVIKTHCLVGKL